MRYIALVLLLCLCLPAVANPPKSANVKVIAYAYYDEYEREWYQVKSLTIEQLDDRCETVEQTWCGVESAELCLDNLSVDSEYRVKVTWAHGHVAEEVYTVWEPGQINLWIDTPD